MNHFIGSIQIETYPGWIARPAHSPRFVRTVAVFEQLGYAKEALGYLQGRSVAIPNQGPVLCIIINNKPLMVERSQVKAFGLEVTNGDVSGPEQTIVVGSVFQVNNQFSVVFAPKVMQKGDIRMVASTDG